MKYIVFCLCIWLASVNVYAQPDAYIFVENSYKNDGSVVIKWITKELFYEQGVNVYRKAEGQANWIKINNSPITLSTNPESLLALVDSNAKSMFKFASSTPYDDFQKSDLMKAFTVLKAITTPELSMLLGMQFFDKDVSLGLKYQYKVMLIEAGKERELAASNSVLVEQYKPSPPPEEINIVRKKKEIEITWKPDEFTYYGVAIYRKASNESAFTNLTSKGSISVQKIPGKDGKKSYPKVFYVDRAIDNALAYEYKFTAINYFGQPSSYSEITRVAVRDFDAPEAPYGLVGDVSKYSVKLDWYASPSSDIAGYKIHRRKGVKGEWEIVTPNLLPDSTINYTDFLDKPGGYYYKVSVIDYGDNETFSNLIFMDVRDVFPPDAPQNLTIEVDTGRIILTWNKNKETDIKGYFIYKTLDNGSYDKNDFALVNSDPIKDTMYSEELSKNIRNRFVYRVHAMDTSYNRSKPSNLSTGQMPDVEPPMKPHLTNVFLQDETIIIDWLKNKDLDLEGYNLFRYSVADSSDLTQINISPIPKDIARYTERDITHDGDYYYYITAIDENDNVSEKSENYHFRVVLNKDESIVVKIAKTQQSKTPRGVKISWNINQNGDFKGYIVYRGESKNNLKPVSGLSLEREFFDKTVAKGKTYFYQVRLYTKNGSIIKSSAKEVKTKK